jgi:hypothetical protein
MHLHPSGPNPDTMGERKRGFESRESRDCVAENSHAAVPEARENESGLAVGMITLSTTPTLYSLRSTPDARRPTPDAPLRSARTASARTIRPPPEGEWWQGSRAEAIDPWSASRSAIDVTRGCSTRSKKRSGPSHAVNVLRGRLAGALIVLSTSWDRRIPPSQTRATPARANRAGQAAG